MSKQKKDQQPITTRYPLDLLAQLRQRARASGRSLNREVIHELRQYQKSRLPLPDSAGNNALSEPEPEPEPLTASSHQNRNEKAVEISMETVWRRYFLHDDPS